MKKKLRIMHANTKPLILMENKSLLIISAIINGTKYAIDNICHIMDDNKQKDQAHNQHTPRKCIFYMKGECIYGTNCRFRHDNL